jgi:hypothetical protein
MFGIVIIKFFGTINGIPEQDFREAKEMSAIWRMIEGEAGSNLPIRLCMVVSKVT